MFVCTNLAELCEEVVEVVHSGRRSDDFVSVTLDIACSDSWTFLTEPGALRRIMMSIIGNALKYTAEGSVSISLHVGHADRGMEKSRENPQEHVIEFTVTDSGKGMSREFLENHLFVPFLQEDSLSEGVGLGMSIVKSLIALLAGGMEIESQSGEGTTIKVSIPMRMPSHKMQTTLDRNVAAIGEQALKVATWGLRPDVERILRVYLEAWFRCTVLPWSRSKTFDVVFIEDGEIPGELRRDELENSPAILALGRRKWASTQPSTDVTETCPDTFGPGRLSKALRKCIAFRQGQVDITHDTTFASRSAGNGAPRPKNTAVEGKPVAEPAATSSKRLETRLPMRKTHSFPDKGNMAIPVASLMTPNKETAADPTPTTTTSEEKRLVEKDLPVAEFPQNHAPALLLVEDNPINLRLLKTYVDKRGYQDIETAQNGLLAVQEVDQRDQGFDIIIVDISMPEMNGFEATRLIRELEGKRRSAAAKAATSAFIVALTGLASADDQAKAYECGVDKFLTKPLKFKELGALLSQWEEDRKG